VLILYKINKCKFELNSYSKLEFLGRVKNAAVISARSMDLVMTFNNLDCEMYSRKARYMQ
jgi:hypothetical protein